jgi:hypothetical protein
MKRKNGTTLVEMVVAVGLSGIFVLLLSGMVSQTMLVSMSGQNQLIATNAAEVVLENARVLGYNELQEAAQQNILPIGMTIPLMMNKTSAQNGPYVRTAPVQLDLFDQTSYVIPEIGGPTGVANPIYWWTPTMGNFFHGTGSITMVDGTPFTIVPSYKLTVQIAYPGTAPAANGSANTKVITRSAYVFQNGGKLQ